MKKTVIIAACLVMFGVGCAHVPSTCTLRNPETGQTVTLSQSSFSGYGYWSIGPAIAKRRQQQELIDSYKAQGYEVIHESKGGL